MEYYTTKMVCNYLGICRETLRKYKIKYSDEFPKIVQELSHNRYNVYRVDDLYLFKKYLVENDILK